MVRWSLGAALVVTALLVACGGRTGLDGSPPVGGGSAGSIATGGGGSGAAGAAPSSGATGGVGATPGTGAAPGTGAMDSGFSTGGSTGPGGGNGCGYWNGEWIPAGGGYYDARLCDSCQCSFALHLSHSFLACTRCDARCTKDGAFYGVEETLVDADGCSCLCTALGWECEPAGC